MSGHAPWLASAKLIPYCGTTFSDQHSARLLAHLTRKNMLNNMTMTGDSLYDVRFASAAAGNVPTNYSSVAAPAKPKARPGGGHCRISHGLRLCHAPIRFLMRNRPLARPPCQGASSVRIYKIVVSSLCLLSLGQCQCLHASTSVSVCVSVCTAVRLSSVILCGQAQRCPTQRCPTHRCPTQRCQTQWYRFCVIP